MYQIHQRESTSVVVNVQILFVFQYLLFQWQVYHFIPQNYFKTVEATDLGIMFYKVFWTDFTLSSADS